MAAEPPVATRVAPRARTRRPWWRRPLVLWLAGPPAVLVALIVATLLWMLVAPIPLGFMSGTFERQMAAQIPGMQLQIGYTWLSWIPGSSRVGFIFTNVELRPSGQQAWMTVPEIDVTFALSALAEGRVAPKRVEFVGLAATLLRQRDGAFMLGLSERPAPDSMVTGGDPKLVQVALEALLTPPETKDLSSYLAEAGIRDAHLTFFDEATGTTLSAPGANLTLERGVDGVKLDFDAAIHLGGGEWEITAQGNYARGSGVIKFEAQFGDLRPAALAGQGALFAGLAGVDLPLHGAFAADISEDGRIQRVFAWAKGAAGAIEMPGLIAEPIQVETADFQMTYDPVTDTWEIEHLSLGAADTHGAFTGAGKILRGEDGAFRGFDGKISGENVTLNLPGVFPSTLVFAQVAFDGSYDLIGGNVAIRNAILKNGDLDFALSGEITTTEAGTAVKLDGTLANLDVADMMTYWPQNVAIGARRWIAKNVLAGHISRGVLKADIPAGAFGAEYLADEMVNFELSFDGVEVNYLDGLTHMTNAKGRATVFGDTFVGKVDSGRVGDIAVSGGDVHIGNLHIDIVPGEIKARASGAISDILALIDMEPLQYPSHYGIKPSSVGGSAQVEISLVLPMRRDVTFKEIELSVKAQAGNLTLPLGPKYVLNEGKIDFDVNGQRLEAQGGAVLAGVPVDIKWRENFEPAENEYPTSFVAEATIDEKAMAELGIEVSDSFTGPVKMDASFEGHGVDVRRGHMAVDMSGAALRIQQFNFYKPPGAAASATMEMTFKDGKLVRIDDLLLAGDLMAATGTVDFAPDGTLRAADFPRVALGPHNDFSLHVVRKAGDTDVAIKGHALDSALVVRDMLQMGSSAVKGGDPQAEAATEVPGLNVTGAVDRIYLRGGATYDDVTFSYRRPKNEPAVLDFEGRDAKGHTTIAILHDRDGNRRVAAQSPDAGNFIAAVFAFDSMRGGSLVADAVLTGNGPNEAAKGIFRIENFKVVDQPFLTRLFAAGSLVGIGDLLSGEGITFTRLEAPFSKANGVWSLDEALAEGPALGISADGYVDTIEDKISVSGVLVPIYGLNSIISSVPLIGDVLAGGEGGGVLGITYSVAGTSEELKVSMNPLSALLPGILRKPFETNNVTPRQATPAPETPALAPEPEVPAPAPKPRAEGGEAPMPSSQ